MCLKCKQIQIVNSEHLPVYSQILVAQCLVPGIWFYLFYGQAKKSMWTIVYFIISSLFEPNRCCKKHWICWGKNVDVDCHKRFSFESRKNWLKADIAFELMVIHAIYLWTTLHLVVYNDHAFISTETWKPNEKMAPVLPKTCCCFGYKQKQIIQ